MRLLGPAGGYALASLCLKLYISPELTPLIDNKDPRWLGAWWEANLTFVVIVNHEFRFRWLGWLLFAFLMFMFAIGVAMLPRELPRSAVRKRIEKEKIKRGLKVHGTSDSVGETKASLKDMVITFKRLFNNKIFMLMNVGSVLHLFG